VETIEGVELMTGGFPAKYGNKKSGVFSINSREPRDKNRYSVGLSLMNARAMGEGRFADGKGSWFLSARRGYLDIVFNLMNLNDLPAPVYYDVFSKVKYELNPQHTVALNVLHAGDRFDIDDFATTGFRDTIKTHETADNSYGNSYVWTTLKSTLSPQGVVESMVAGGLVTKKRHGAEVFSEIPGGVYGIGNERDFNLLSFKQDWLYEHSGSMLLGLGYDVRRLDTDYSFDNVVEQDPNDPSDDPLGYYPVETRTAIERSGTLAGVYLSNRMQVLEPLTLELGLRYDRASYSKDSDLSPRLNAMYQVAPTSFLRVGWGQYRQIQGIEEVNALDENGNCFASELSEQWMAGFDHRFDSGANFRLEEYVKNGSHPRPVFRNWVAGALDVFPETNEDRFLVYPIKSTGKGFEVYYAQDSGRKTSLSGSYAFASADEELSRVVNVNVPEPILFELPHPGPQDQRHALNLDLTYRPSATWSMNFSYAYHSGWPTTLRRPSR
jgi:hypothetical protein